MKIGMPEIWKPVTTYEGLYEVSNKGFVRSIKTQKIIIKKVIFKNNLFESCFTIC